MKNRFTVDVLSGSITRSINGSNVSDAQNGTLTMRDVLDCEVVIKAGATDITADALPEGYDLTLGLRKLTSTGALLAQSTPHTMVGGVANCVLDLNTAEIVALVEQITSNTSRGVTVYFEVQISKADGTYRQTIAQKQITLQCEVNMEGDEPPPTAAASANTASGYATQALAYRNAAAAAAAMATLTSYAAVRAITTAAGAIVTDAIRFVVRNSALEVWHLRAGTDADDDANILRPSDFNAATNALVWERVS